MAFNAVAEKAGDGIGEYQRIVKFLGNVFVNYGFAAVAIAGPQQMGVLVIGNRFNDKRLNMLHGFS